MRLKFSLAFLLLFSSNFLAAQFPDTLGGGDGIQKEINLLITPDTTKLHYFYPVDLSQKYLQFDTSIYDNHKFAPSRRQQFPYATTGILGGAAHPMFFEEKYQRGVDLGLHQYDLYQVHNDQLRFYESLNGYAKARYAAGAEQADGYLDFNMSRKFDKGYYIATEIDRIFQLGTRNQFEHQNLKNLGFLVGVGYRPEDSKYKAFLLQSSNVQEVFENGGIREENLDALSERVNLNVAETRHDVKEFKFIHSLNFQKRPDSTGRKKRSFTISHQLSYRWADYKFFDERPPFAGTDSSFYKSLVSDERGIRFYTEHNTFRNQFSLLTFKNNESKKRRDYLEAGIDHRFHSIDLQPETIKRNNLFLFGKWRVEPNKSLKFNALGHFGILDNAGDYRVEGKLGIEIPKVGKVKGSFINQLNSPSVLHERFNLNFEPLWENDFTQTLSTTVKGSIQPAQIKSGLFNLNIETGIKYDLLNNYIYFDSLSVPNQTSIPISIFKFWADVDVQFYKFHLDNSVAFQSFSESNLFQLPRFYSENSFYFEDYLFKDELGLRIGIESRFFGPYQPMGYQPLTGQFYLQNEFSTNSYPALNIFASLKRKRFQGYLVIENAQEYFGGETLTNNFSQRYYYEVANYPYYPSMIRWGVVWEFFN